MGWGEGVKGGFEVAGQVKVFEAVYYIDIAAQGRC